MYRPRKCCLCCLIVACVCASASAQSTNQAGPSEGFVLADKLLWSALNDLDSGAKRQAAAQLERALKIAKREDTIGPKKDQFIGFILYHLAMALDEPSSVASAEARAREALDQFEKALPAVQFPDGHPLITGTLGLIGDLCEKQSKLREARRCFERALTMCEKLFPLDKHPKGHAELAAAHHRMGQILELTGEFDSACNQYRIAVEVWRRLAPDGNPELAITLNNWGYTEQQRGDLDLALTLFQEALSLALRLHGESHRSTINSRINVGYNLYARGNYALAQLHFEALVESTADDGSLYPWVLHNLASTLLHQDKFNLAEKRNAESISAYERAFGTSVPAALPMAKVYYAQGDIRNGQGRPQLAVESYSKAVAIENRIASEVAYLSEAEALNLAARFLHVPDRLLSASVNFDSQPEIYELLWQRRGTVQRLAARRKKIAQQSPEAQEAYEECLEAAAGLVRVHLRQLRDPLADLRRPWKEATEAKEAAERRLADIVGDKLANASSTAWTDLTASLPSDCVFVDFLTYYSIEDAGKIPGERRYVAFVVKQDADIARIELGNADTIDERILQWRRALTSSSGGDQVDGSSLRELIWDKLVDHIPPSGIVFLCPDGLLADVPWSAIPLDDDNELLIDRFAVALVPHGQYIPEWIGESHAADSTNKLLLVANVDYGMPSQGKRSWSPIESDLAGALAADGIDAKLLQGLQPTSTNVQRELSKAGSACIETHGFFLSKDEGASSRFEDVTDVTLPRPLSEPSERSPFLRSGMALADANIASNSDHESFILAETIATLDLSRMDWVFLSACDSALAETHEGTAHYGLQSAFHQAGTRTAIGALWRVDAKATRALFERFFRHVSNESSPLGKLQAFRRAQLALRNDVFDGSAPYYWAGWSFSGDPGAPISIDTPPAAAADSAGENQRVPLLAEPQDTDSWHHFLFYGILLILLVVLAVAAYLRWRPARSRG